jgi:hypothetical protein
MISGVGIGKEHRRHDRERVRIDQRDVHAEKDGLQLWLEADVVQRFRADYGIFPLAGFTAVAMQIFISPVALLPA